jgi:hypothetical protein
MMIYNDIFTVSDSKSILSFETAGGGQWEVWDRYLSIDGSKAYHIGNICGTCEFFFERLDGANRNVSVDEIREQLQNGLVDLNKQFIDQIKPIIPDGEYKAFLNKIIPNLIELGTKEDYFSNEQVQLWGIDGFWDMPFHPKTKYYRGNTIKFNEYDGLFEFFVPMFPQGWLDEDTIEKYKKLISHGNQPTALSISVLDVKEPYDSYEKELEVCKHWCLTHYIIDGHHKLYTSSQVNKPITLLSFLAVNQGIASKEEVEEMLRVLKEVR